ncbi:MAG: phospho-N-acetylmuramoyl-pentapeptide-transferase [Bacteroidia bacterium]|nr:phospho-N-acetylmuramoyl-pentapeptide-transferase [Bacteroidia bacterium]
MLYHLFSYLDHHYNIAGFGVWTYLTFRTGLAVILSLTISAVYGKRLINALHRLQVSETIRDLGLQGEEAKKGTPTMGGLIMLGAILIPTLLLARLTNVYVLLMIAVTVLTGLIGFVDDYIKVFKKDKAGLSGKFKIMGQIIVGIVVALTLYFNKAVVVTKHYSAKDAVALKMDTSNMNVKMIQGERFFTKNEKSLTTTIPFFKFSEFDYNRITKMIGLDEKWGWVIFTLFVIFLVTAVSNGANITDGIDGLAAGTSAIIGTTLGLFAFVSGNILIAKYLNIMYIPHLGELFVFAGAFMGACIGFLWYNSYPAQVFMGDTGSLMLGGVIAALAIIVRKELLIPILCGVFLIENLSVMIQVSYFKYTKKKTGEGKRVFLMSPIHHHYQKKGFHEAKIVTRFWIIGIILAVVSFITLKLR